MRAKGNPGAPRAVESQLGIKRGHGNAYVEYDAMVDDILVEVNPRTGVVEFNIRGDVDLSDANATFHSNR